MIVNAAMLVEQLRKVIEKNPNAGTYMVVDPGTGCVLLLSMSEDLNLKIKAWFHMQIQKGNAAGTTGRIPEKWKWRNT